MDILAWALFRKTRIINHIIPSKTVKLYSYSLIALAIARVITGHTRTSKSTDYCPNCMMCVIN